MTDEVWFDELTVLKEARALITPPRRWVQGHEHAVSPLGFHQYCAIGAVRHVGVAHGLSGYGIALVIARLDHKSGELFSSGGLRPTVMTVNDRRGHKPVLRVFDAAIAELEPEQETRRRWFNPIWRTRQEEPSID